ncbi:MAG TPA: extracellular solute-binding protein [Ruania sp.]|nr:extracellular solute-binding protein [Ruania sp.]
MHFRMRTALAAGVTAAAMTLAACSGPGSGDEPSEEFTYWSMWKEGEPQQKVMAQAIEDFEAETGITVDVQWQGRDNVQRTVPTLSTHTGPDLVDSSYVKLYPALVATQQAHGLDQAWQTEVEDGKSVSDLIPQSYLDSIDIMNDDGQPWMVPYNLTSDAIWFNEAEYPDIAKNPPQTWDEFIDLLDKLQDDGVAPIAVDGDIPGYNAYWFTTIYLRLAGPGALYELASDKTGAAWDAPEVLEAAKKVQQLVDGGYFIDGYDASKFPTQQQRWATGKAALLFMGSWAPTETSSYASDGFEYASFAFPKVGDSGHDSARADFSGFAVPANAEHADAAQKFIAFYLQNEYQQALATEAGLIPIRADVDPSPEQAEVVQHLKNAETYHQQNDGVAFPSYNSRVLWTLDDDLMLGNITAEEFVQKAQAGTVEYWKNQG